MTERLQEYEVRSVAKEIITIATDENATPEKVQEAIGRIIDLAKEDYLDSTCCNESIVSLKSGKVPVAVVELHNNLAGTARV